MHTLHCTAGLYISPWWAGHSQQVCMQTLHCTAGLYIPSPRWAGHSQQVCTAYITLHCRPVHPLTMVDRPQRYACIHYTALQACTSPHHGGQAAVNRYAPFTLHCTAGLQLVCVAIWSGRPLPVLEVRSSNPARVTTVAENLMYLLFPYHVDPGLA